MLHYSVRIKCVQASSFRFPYLLTQIPDPPAQLYYRGIWSKINYQTQPFLAIVGSRNPSQYGIKITQKWAYALAKQGVILVSGLALGIDTIVHKSALKAGTATIAVLGSAINQVYPKQNSNLYWQIPKQQGLVVSEFAPNQKTNKQQFITRNRIISGLCKAVLVVEGSLYSGTLITARYAAQQGREVFVLPGQVNNIAAQAPLLLLQQGATPVLSVTDILKAL